MTTPLNTINQNKGDVALFFLGGLHIQSPQSGRVIRLAGHPTKTAVIEKELRPLYS
jgi:hypothetical protein